MIVDVIAPSYPLEIDLKLVADAVAKFGLKARIPENLQITNADPFSASDDENRLLQLVTAINAQDSDYIWAFRGGYGAARLLSVIPDYYAVTPGSSVVTPGLTRGLTQQCITKPKIFIGFSDATALHIYFIQKFGWKTIHARGISEYARGMGTEQEIIRLKDILAGGKTAFENIKPLNAAAKKNIVINSKVIGGNLCLIEDSIGTDWQIDTEDKILLIEEVGERGYRVDRMLVHLQQAGVFLKAKAVILGQIICAKEPDGKELCDLAVARFAASLAIPVIQIDTIGHGKENWPIPLNTDAVLKLGEAINLEIDAIC